MARSHGVEWHLPGLKRPFAVSTQATSLLVELSAQEGRTVSQARAWINYDSDAHEILDRYIAEGYGEERLSDILANRVPRKRIARVVQ